MERGNKSARQQQYQQKVKQIQPKPTIFRNVLWAFVVGGLICTFGQFVQNYLIEIVGMSQKDAAGPVATIMVFLGAFLTGLGVYDNIGKYAGAGSIVPITGFANSVVSPAMEFKREGYVFGVGARMFTIAGPVIAYGTAAAVLVGFFHWFRQ